MITSTGNRRRWPRDEKPVPKSSIAIRTPSAWSSSARRGPARRRRPRRRWRSRSPPARARGARARLGEDLRTTPLEAAGGELLAGDVDPGDEAIGSTPSCSHSAVCAHASRSTNSPSGMISPVASATGMNCPAVTRPRVGERQRASASTPTIASMSSSISRLVVERELVALEAEPQLVLEPEQLAELARHVVLEDLEAAPAGLLRRVHRDVGVADELVAVAAAAGVHGDADARAEQRARGRRSRSARERRSSSRSRERRSASASWRAFEQQRELVAAETRQCVARARDRSRTARRPRCRSWSPASWPRLSFTCLKPSRSTSRTASGSRERADRASAWSRRSRKRARLASPVRPSWNACRVSSSSSRTRSVTSRALRTTPRTCRSPRRSVTFASRLRHSPNLFSQPEEDLARPPLLDRRGRPRGRRPVDEALEAASEHVCARAAEHRRDRVADVAAAFRPKTSTRSVEEVTRLRKCAVCRRVGGDQPEGEEDRDEEAGEPENHLNRRQAADVPVGAGGDRPGGVERHVRGDCREDAETFDGLPAAMCSPAVNRTDSTGRCARYAVPVAIRSATSRCSCRSWSRAVVPLVACKADLVVVAVDGRSDAPVEQPAGALHEHLGDRRRIGRVAAPREQDLVDVARGERPLASRDLDDGGLMLRAPGRPQREGDRERRERART